MSDDKMMTVRFPTAWYAEIDELVEKFSVPGAKSCRTDVVRMALREGLDVLKKRKAR